MKPVIDEKTVRLGYEAKNWRDAIQEAGRLLLEAGIVEPRYVNAMIHMVEEYGPYMIVAPGVAVPHARAENGTKKSGISFLHLSRPVIFPQKQNNPVEILIGLAAADESQHLETFGRVAGKLAEQETLEQLKRCVSPEEVVRILNE